MTLPQKVQDAVDYLHCVVTSSHLPGWKRNREEWATIRAELHRLTEIADGAAAKVEAGNALLRGEAALLRAWARESREGGWSTHQVGPMNRRADELDKHLKGAGDE